MVLFRATTVSGAWSLWKGMIGAYGVTLPQAVFSHLGPLAHWLAAVGIHGAWTSGSLLLEATLRIGILLVIALGDAEHAGNPGAL